MDRVVLGSELSSSALYQIIARPRPSLAVGLVPSGGEQAGASFVIGVSSWAPAITVSGSPSLRATERRAGKTRDTSRISRTKPVELAPATIEKLADTEPRRAAKEVAFRDRFAWLR